MKRYRTEIYQHKGRWGFRVNGPTVWAQSGTKYKTKQGATRGAERWIAHHRNGTLPPW